MNKNPTFPTFSGSQYDIEIIAKELEDAGIAVVKNVDTKNRAVDCKLCGFLYPWNFHREFDFWIATGPGIPPEETIRLYIVHGADVRVGVRGGSSRCPPSKGFATGLYNVYTQEGLKALVKVIEKLAEKKW